MKQALYSSLQNRIVVVTLLASFTPLIILGISLYYQFDKTIRAKIEEQARYRTLAQAESVDLFLKERSAILAAMADTHSFDFMIQGDHLSRTLEVINSRAGAFVDLGVIDSNGIHRAYVGPYGQLEGISYYNEAWFVEVMARGLYISDVYLGFRRSPHFIIAVRRQENNKSWILRATIDPEIFGGIVRAAQIGQTGDAYIVNREGVFQTASRFGGGILEKSNINTQLFGGGTTVLEKESPSGTVQFFAGTWLKNSQWLLIISQETEGEMSRLFATRDMEIIIVVGGMLAIFLATLFSTRLIIGRLRESDIKMTELNAQLMQSDKLAALGKMAAGVAHEINNPLAVILQKTGWMVDLLDEEDFKSSKNMAEYRESLRKIEEHVERARKVVHGMLGYARKMEPHLEDVDVNQILNQTMELLDNFARVNNIDMKADLAPNLPVIAGDQAQLQQVFMNLLSNAIDAIGQNGEILARTATTGTHIQIHIQDNGPGMTEDQRKRIFEPFFTTKPAGKGTGLGLWISYSIVEKLGGTITVKSEPGKGTVFTVRIPVIIPEKK